MTSLPCAYRARAWWGDQLVADTTDALVADGELLFPSGDVRTELIDADGTLAGEVDPRDPARWTAEDLPASIDGIKAARQVDGHVAFDHTRLRVELVDDRDPRVESVVRFPCWGDGTDLIRLMDLQPDGPARFTGPGWPHGGRPVVEGSQILGQSIIAAMRHVPGRRVVSAHMVFLKAADARVPLDFEIVEHSNGRQFSALGVSAVQDGRVRATGTILLDVTAPDLLRHSEPAPATGPYDSVPYDMAVSGRDLRVAEATYTDDPDAPVGPPVIDAWVRFREVPSDPAIHAGLLAQFMGHMPIAAALRPHAGIGQASAHRTISTGINAITVAFHADVRMDEWVRYHHHSTFAGSGMTHAECRVYDEADQLVASFTVDGMVRAFAPQAAGDARTAL